MNNAMWVALLFVILFFNSHLAHGEDCDNSQRQKYYGELKTKLTEMYDLLPAQKPQDIAFYKEVAKNVYLKPEKYKRYLSDNGYVLYDNTNLIENLLYWTDLSIEAVKSNAFTAEVHSFSLLMHGGVTKVTFLKSLRDSKYMAEKGIVSKAYAEHGTDIGLVLGGIALCMADHAEALTKKSK